MTEGVSYNSRESHPFTKKEEKSRVNVVSIRTSALLETTSGHYVC